MIRYLFGAIILTGAATAASAQTAGGPEIAFIKNGSGEIYLTDRQGSSLTRLYTAPRKTSLRWLDIKPGGNQLAFMQGLSIRIQQYHDNGQPNGAAESIPGAPCAYTQSPDYHPSGDGRLVFIAACGFGNFHVMTYKLGDSAPTPLFTVNSANRIRWSRTGEHLIYDDAESRTSSVARLKRRNVSSGAVEDFGTISDLTSFDIRRSGDRLVYGPATAPRQIDFATMTDTPLGCDGDDIHFSPDDSRMVYETPPAKGGTYILTKASDCSGSPSALTGKGDWSSKDWRPDVVTP